MLKVKMMILGTVLAVLFAGCGEDAQTSESLD